MQGVGLDRVDLPRRPPAQQQQEGAAEQQPSDARHQDGAQRIDLVLAGEMLPGRNVKQHLVHLEHGRAHRRDHQSADGSNHRRQQNQARFMGAHEGAEPSRRFNETETCEHTSDTGVRAAGWAGDRNRTVMQLIGPQAV